MPLISKASSLNSQTRLEILSPKKAEKHTSSCWTDMEKENSIWLTWDISTNNSTTVLMTSTCLNCCTQSLDSSLTRFPCTSSADTWPAKSPREELPCKINEIHWQVNKFRLKWSNHLHLIFKKLLKTSQKILSISYLFYLIKFRIK